MTSLYASGDTLTSAVSSTCAKRKKKISTPVTRWATHDHIPPLPRYSVPAGAWGTADPSSFGWAVTRRPRTVRRRARAGRDMAREGVDGVVHDVHIVVTHRRPAYG